MPLHEIDIEQAAGTLLLIFIASPTLVPQLSNGLKRVDLRLASFCFILRSLATLTDAKEYDLGHADHVLLFGMLSERFGQQRQGNLNKLVRSHITHKKSLKLGNSLDERVWERLMLCK